MIQFKAVDDPKRTVVPVASLGQYLLLAISMVNKDSQLATSWWKTYKKRNPAAVPLFLTDAKDDLDDRVYSKRPLSPSVLRSAVQDLVSQTRA